jgi:hypothetical protein
MGILLLWLGYIAICIFIEGDADNCNVSYPNVTTYYTLYSHFTPKTPCRAPVSVLTQHQILNPFENVPLLFTPNIS